MEPEATAALLGQWGYPAYFVLFLATAFGSPVTEDLLLLIGGWLVGGGVFSWHVALPLSYVGILATDLLLYTFGRKLRSHSLRRRWLRKLIRPGRLRIATRWFARFGDWVVFAARFIPGTRMLVFASAGLRGMRPLRFLVLDGLAALVWVPLLVGLGWELGTRVAGVNETLRWVSSRVSWLIVVAAVAFAARRLWLAIERYRFGPTDAEP